MAKAKRKAEPARRARSAAKNGSDNANQLRIRMYRVGFGDFFLITAWSKDGPQHILVDCGVTRGKTGEGDIGTIKTAVRHMAQETDDRLALSLSRIGIRITSSGSAAARQSSKSFQEGLVGSGCPIGKPSTRRF
jgi:hypothetical protein